MRSIKLVPALAAAATLLMAVLGGTAAAGKRPSHDKGRHLGAGGCQVNINVTPHRFTAGDPVVIFGGLVCQGGASVANQTVALFQHLPTGRGYSQVQSATTDAGGFYEFSSVGAVNTESAWFVRSDGAKSLAVQVGVAAQVTLQGPPDRAQLLTGAANKVTFTGTVNPTDAGSAVVLQRQDAAAGNVWHRIDAIGQVGPEGGFSIVHTFPHPGAANVRVVVTNRGHVNPHNIPSPSNVLSYEISQAQIPGLTIQASADPISAGQSVTISGTAAPGAGKQVTLLARIGTQKFVQVAKATTDGGGKYTFPAQSPTAGTLYMVKRAGKASAQLYEGVSDALTAQVSQTTIQAGQPLTFAGTVAPDHSGHALYLERQNASGTGFHVVQLAAVGSGSSYSIVHTVYDAGTDVFRVAIPGGPENEGAASAPFSIEVTPAPADALMPEAPGNSSLPVGGQF
jgi:hypothetical protein